MFDPGAEIAVWHIVLRLTGANTRPAADALGDVNQHAPPVFRLVVVWRGLGSSGEYVLPRDCGGGKQNQYLTAGDVHLAAPDSITGLCG